MIFDDPLAAGPVKRAPLSVKMRAYLPKRMVGVRMLPKNPFAPHLFAGRYLPGFRGRNRPDPGDFTPACTVADNQAIVGNATEPTRSN